MRNIIIEAVLSALLATAGGALADDAFTARHDLYADGPAPGYAVRAWNQLCSEPREGAGRYLWLNGDWKALPWAGVTLETRGEGLCLDQSWLDAGFVRFLLNAGRDRHGNPGAAPALQLRPITPGVGYQRLLSRSVDRGRGTDEDPATWQEVLVPLSYWTELKAGAVVTGVSVQNYDQALLDVGLDELGFVRFAALPDWLQAQRDADVCQPWVEWPAYADLPPALQADRQTARVANGAFVNVAGQRVFLLSPYCREDQRLDVWGTTDETRRGTLPSHGLFEPSRHAWIYADELTAESLSRLGFNTYSATMVPQPFWDAVGLSYQRTEADPARLPSLATRLRVPFYVDTVCWPWTLGRPGDAAAQTPLPAEALTQGRHHWVPYRITGRGRDTWLAMWRLYARRYRDAGVPVFAYELLNEPAYLGISADHRRDFAGWLRRRYAAIDDLNRTWGTTFPDWDQAVDLADDERVRRIAGRCFDYDEMLSERFCELVRDGVQAVHEILPDALVGVQVMGGYALAPREAVWKHRFCPYEGIVLTPTGGGRWTSGRPARQPAADPLDTPMAAAPLENDLLLTLAGPRMIFDNETYPRGQTARALRNSLWQHAIAGVDGLTVFSWSRRGWVWWRTRKEVQTEADKYPYCLLNPLARRTEALRGICDFAGEMQRLAPRLLPKPWGPEPAIGLLVSWPQARRRTYDANTPDKTEAYYAALKYSHWNLAALPSDRFLAGQYPGSVDILVAGGVGIGERELPDRLRAFAEAGGTVILGEAVPDHDLYGLEIPGGSAWTGVSLPEAPAAAATSAPGTVPPGSSVRRVEPLPDTAVLHRDPAGRPILTRHALGRGAVYFQAADVVGYPLGQLLGLALSDLAGRHPARPAASPLCLAEITDMRTGKRATNVLLSRRSHPSHHALLLLNPDGFAKTLRLTVPDLQGSWRVTEALSGTLLAPTWTGQSSVTLTLAAESPAVVLFETP